MKLLILGLEQALEHVPSDRTYAIRIDSNLIPYCKDFQLKKSGLYTITEYVFDDRTPEIGRGKLFDIETAKRLLTEFKERGLTQETLLVHCLHGKNRSPAVGIALNDIFNLGDNADKLKKQFPETAWFVYNILMETAHQLSYR